MNNRVLLSENKEKAEAQRIFNEIALEKLNAIRSIFNRLRIGELSLRDLEMIGSGNWRGVIKSKLLNKTKDIQVAGFPIKADKAIELLDLDSTEFELAVSEFGDWFRREVSQSRMNNSTIELNKQFFKLTDTGFIIDVAHVDKWVNTTCNIYTTNPTQVKVHKLVNQLCDTLNELQSIKLDPTTSRQYTNKFSTEVFKTNPSKIFDEEGLCEMIILQQGKFVVNKKFVVNH